MGYEHDETIKMADDRPMPGAKLGDVRQQVERIDETINRLFKIESELEDQLYPILRSAEPSEADDPNDIPLLVPLAEQLYNVNETLNRLQYRLLLLSERVNL